MDVFVLMAILLFVFVTLFFGMISFLLTVCEKSLYTMIQVWMVDDEYGELRSGEFIFKFYYWSIFVYLFLIETVFDSVGMVLLFFEAVFRFLISRSFTFHSLKVSFCKAYACFEDYGVQYFMWIPIKAKNI